MADKIVHTVDILRTKNYEKFKKLAGNRPTNPQHVARLVKKIKENGNLTPHFPIDVNENLEVIDGQHRLAALQILEEPVYYQVKPTLDIDSVISLNTNQKNWGWRDFAESWAERGNKNYQEFLELVNQTGEKRFGVLIFYASLGERYGHGGSGRTKAKDTFNDGEFEMRDYGLSLKYLGQFQEMSQVAKVNHRDFAYACFRYMQRPKYDHERMIDKLAAFGGGLQTCYTLTDYIKELDAIYRS